MHDYSVAGSKQEENVHEPRISEQLSHQSAHLESSIHAAVAPYLITGRIFHVVEGVSAKFAQLAASSINWREILIDGDIHAVEVITPSARDGYAVLHLHGGGYATGSVWFYAQFLRRLSEATKSRVFSVSYRKAPEHPFPAALDDAVAAWRWLLSQGFAASSVAVLGDSAGGNLAFALLVRLAQLKDPQPAACLGMSPWLLLDPERVAQRKSASALHVDETPEDQRTSHRWSLTLSAVRAVQASSIWEEGARFLVGQYSQGHDPCDPLISPLLVSDELLRCFPPVLIHVDKDEPLANEASDMAARCQQVGVPVELHFYAGTMHGMQIVNVACKEEARDSLNRIHLFLEKIWKPSYSCAEDSP